MIFVLTLLLYW